MRRVVVVALLLVPFLTARADGWESLRDRPGNDDVFVMIDTSRAMVTAGSLETVKAFAQDLFARYLKDGDRVVLLAFDAEARVHGVMDIAHRTRDVEVLREMVEAIDVRRVIRYRGSWPDLTEAADGPWIGGSAFSDYCEMWRLSGRVLQAYGDPSHRQTFLLFTTGASSSSPEYRSCSDPRPPAALITRLRENRLRLGLVTIPPANGLPPPLRSFVEQMATQSRTGIESLKVIELQAGRSRADLAPKLLELLNSRVDLIGPEKGSLSVNGQGDVRVWVTAANRSAAPRTIYVRSAALHLDGTASPLPLVVTPSVIRLDPGDSAVVTLSGAALLTRSGRYRGRVVFQFEAGARFDPAIVPFDAAKESWLEHHGVTARWTLLIAAALSTCAIARLVVDKTRTIGPACSWRGARRDRRGRS
ncbi:MAG TPA: hypothetical protein VF883_18835 [Thermoanaerobaculia bacterium]